MEPQSWGYQVDWNASTYSSEIKISSILNIQDDISLKLPAGPTTSPNPGPTLDIDVAAPEIDVIKSKPDIDSRIVITKKIIKYKKIKEIIEEINLLFIFSLL